MPQRNNGQRPTVKCALCGRSEEEVDFLIPSPTGRYICNFCVETCYSLVHGSDLGESPVQVSRNASPLNSLPTPKEIKALLDEYVIGQDKAKIALSVAVYNHYKRIYSVKPSSVAPAGKNGDDGNIRDVELQKSNVLLIGPTGVGKTFLAQTLAKALDVPFAIADATTLTEAGYVGEDVENILLRLIQAADYDVAKAEKGIIYVDEIDKISRRSENRSITRDVSGEGVQQALLKILEGTLANVPAQGGRKHPTQAMIQINTENILFICGGAFDNLDQIIEQRKGQSGIGFQSNIQKKEEKKKSGIFKDVTPHDIVKYGLIPELVGRLPVIVGLDDLDRDALVKILTEPKNSITKQYRKLLDMDGVELEFTDDALGAVADKAIARNTGARGLRSILEEILTDVMFSVPSRKDVAKVTITRECVEGNGGPELTLKEKKQRPAE